LKKLRIPLGLIVSAVVFTGIVLEKLFPSLFPESTPPRTLMIAFFVLGAILGALYFIIVMRRGGHVGSHR
jgi:protein-S-isoprenylcysteine O-methyltransferase Ste14